MNINFKTRQLIRSTSRGYLSTEFIPNNFKKLKLDISKPFSYSTFVMTAFDYDLSPILLLSNLSEHTTNILNNSLISLMVCEENNLYNFFPKFNNKFPDIDYEDPMSRPRVTLIGKLKKTKVNKTRKKQTKKQTKNRRKKVLFKDDRFLWGEDIKNVSLSVLNTRK